MYSATQLKRVPWIVITLVASGVLTCTAQESGEFIFVNNWLNPEHSNNKAWMKTEVMIEANTANSASYANFPGNTGNDQWQSADSVCENRNL